MFDNNRYMTKGVKNKVPVELQLFMWNCIDKLKEQGQKLDYLQVFELSIERIDDIFFEKVEHRQEVPKYKINYEVFPKEMINAKIFVVDDGEQSVMMLAEEY